MVPAQLVAVWNLRLRGGSEGPTLIANAALLRVILSTSDYPPHSWHNRPLDIKHLQEWLATTAKRVDAALATEGGGDACYG